FAFFFNEPETTLIYTLSLHDALPIFSNVHRTASGSENGILINANKILNWNVVTVNDDYDDYETDYQPFEFEIKPNFNMFNGDIRSEEHTSELQSRENLVCRLLLEKKK